VGKNGKKLGTGVVRIDSTWNARTLFRGPIGGTPFQYAPRTAHTLDRSLIRVRRKREGEDWERHLQYRENRTAELFFYQGDIIRRRKKELVFAMIIGSF